LKLNRKIPPPIREISKLNLPRPEQITLDNGIPLYITNLGVQEIVKLELVFRAGRPFERKQLVSRATAALMKEGTASMASGELAERIDFYGGSLSIPYNLDTGSLILYCLTKHFEHLLPILTEIIVAPAFPIKELETFVETSLQAQQIELTKADIVAYRKITEYIFGSTHAYGYNSEDETYHALTQADLMAHHEAFYHAGNCEIFISGKISAKETSLVNQYFGTMHKGQVVEARNLDIITPLTKTIILPHEDKSQTAIKIGCRLFTRHHEDYFGMFILNTILGGYFGSRLMMNIRENKGYTYNIYSSIEPMLYDGYFYIATEADKKFSKKVVEEIHKECAKLRNEPIEAEELTMVRNYLLGNILTMLDGPLNVSELVRTYISEGVNLNRFDELVQKIKTITPDEIQHLAQKYLKTEEMWQVKVGK
jgi:zinc protease